LQYLELQFQALPDVRLDVLDAVAEGDVVAVRARGTATHKGDFMGIPASGNTVESEFADFFRLNDDGKVVELWSYYDQLAFLQQLGAVHDNLPG
jgi:steroid delta-isomerase-like uncharacterized protein